MSEAGNSGKNPLGLEKWGATTKDDMDAFDRLPFSIRGRLRDMPMNMAAQPILQAYLKAGSPGIRYQLLRILDASNAELMGKLRAEMEEATRP